MTEKKNPAEDAIDENSTSIAEATKLSRRNLLKIGAASAPVVISLQSGSAWAQSISCAERVIFPVANPDNEASLIEILQKEGGLNKNEAEAQVSVHFTRQAYEPGNLGHQAFLKAEVTSCWSSLYE